MPQSFTQGDQPYASANIKIFVPNAPILMKGRASETWGKTVAVDRVLARGLKGRFCQPRSKTWETERKYTTTLKGSFMSSFGDGNQAMNGPFRAGQWGGVGFPTLRVGL
jgi:hypothetical protein